MPTWYSSKKTFIATEESLTIVAGNNRRDYSFSDVAKARQEISDAFDIETLAEIDVYFHEMSLPSQERILHRQRPQSRMHLSTRYFSDNLGRGPCQYNVWIQSEKIIYTVDSQYGLPRVEQTLEEFVERGGFPEAYQAVIGKDSVAPQIVSIVRELLTLPCFCGAGGDRPGHFRHLQYLGSFEPPDVYGDDRTSMYRCRVCGSGWKFREYGDSHYGYTYSATSLPW